MCNDARIQQVSNPKYCYETGCLVSVADTYPIHCHRIDNLLWTEIDNATHLRRAYDLIYPRIQEVDEAFA